MRRLERQLHDKPAAEPRGRAPGGDAPVIRLHQAVLRHDIGIVENIHLSSHSKKKPSALKSAKDRDDKRFAIEGSSTWELNGHRELVCKCGMGTTVRKVRLDEDGRAVVRVAGKCKTCGDILLTSGMWRTAQNPDRIVKAIDDADREHVDWAIGNPFTFNDRLASEYGVPRFNSQEGALGSQFTQRFGLLEGKRWFYRRSQVDLEVSMVVTLTHVLSLERWRRMNADPSRQPRPERLGDSERAHVGRENRHQLRRPKNLDAECPAQVCGVGGQLPLDREERVAVEHHGVSKQARILGAQVAADAGVQLGSTGSAQPRGRVGLQARLRVVQDVVRPLHETPVGGGRDLREAVLREDELEGVPRRERHDAAKRRDIRPIGS
jgi:hypothetical protein